MEEDAVALAETLGPTMTPEATARVQARMVAWAIEAIPQPTLEANAAGGPWAAVAAAVGQVAAGRAPDPATLGVFLTWHQAQRPDWATQQALDEMADALTRVLGPASGMEGHEPDVGATAFEIVRATAFWRWDEMLAEAAGHAGDHDGRQSAQEDERDRVVADAHRALCALLRAAA